MKWNWGTKLVVSMAAFMTMVIVFVVLMMQQSVDLVESDYYPKGQAHQQLIDKRNNAAVFADSILVKHLNDMVQIQFPQKAITGKVEGKVHFYQRVSDKNDQVAKLTVDSLGIFRFPANLLKGRYVVKIDWISGGNEYYAEKTLDLP
jgi:hypothetical protein